MIAQRLSFKQIRFQAEIKFYKGVVIRDIQPCYTIPTYATEKGPYYIIWVNFPVYNNNYLQNYIINGSYDILTNIGAMGSEYIPLLSSEYLTEGQIDEMREVNQRKQFEIERNSNWYLSHDKSKSFTQKSIYKKIGTYDLLLQSMYCEIPMTIGDDWVNKFYDYKEQRN